MNNIILSDEERKILIDLIESSIGSWGLDINDLSKEYKHLYSKLGGQIKEGKN